MNRHQRRAAEARDRGKLGGGGARAHTRRASREKAARLVAAEAAALTMSAEQAREILARWAAAKGHTIEEVERLNGEGEKAFQGKLR